MDEFSESKKKTKTTTKSGANEKDQTTKEGKGSKTRPLTMRLKKVKGNRWRIDSHSSLSSNNKVQRAKMSTTKPAQYLLEAVGRSQSVSGRGGRGGGGRGRASAALGKAPAAALGKAPTEALGNFAGLSMDSPVASSSSSFSSSTSSFPSSSNLAFLASVAVASQASNTLLNDTLVVVPSPSPPPPPVPQSKGPIYLLSQEEEGGSFTLTEGGSYSIDHQGLYWSKPVDGNWTIVSPNIGELVKSGAGEASSSQQRQQQVHLAESIGQPSTQPPESETATTTTTTSIEVIEIFGSKDDDDDDEGKNAQASAIDPAPVALVDSLSKGPIWTLGQISNEPLEEQSESYVVMGQQGDGDGGNFGQEGFGLNWNPLTGFGDANNNTISDYFENLPALDLMAPVANNNEEGDLEFGGNNLQDYFENLPALDLIAPVANNEVGDLEFGSGNLGEDEPIYQDFKNVPSSNLTNDSIGGAGGGGEEEEVRPQQKEDANDLNDAMAAAVALSGIMMADDDENNGDGEFGLLSDLSFGEIAGSDPSLYFDIENDENGGEADGEESAGSSSLGHLSSSASGMMNFVEKRSRKGKSSNKKKPRVKVTNVRI